MFFVDRLAAFEHGGVQIRIPESVDGRAGECEFSDGGGAVVGGAQAPGAGAVAGDHGIGHLDAWPVEVAMVVELDAGIGQLSEQDMQGGSGLAFGADERSALTAQAVGSRGDDVRVLADEYARACHFGNEARWRAPELAEGEMAGLTGIRAGIEHAADVMRAGRAQVEHQHRGAEVVQQHAQRSPGLAPGRGVVPAMHAAQRGGQTNDEGAERLASVERVGVADGGGGQFGQRHAVGRQARGHRQRLAQQGLRRSDAVAAQQTLASQLFQP